MFSTIEAFGHKVAALLDIEPPVHISPYDGLFDDWGLDSLQAFQLIIIIEGIAEVAVPPPSIPEIFTVGDAYDYYRSLVNSGEN